MNSQLILTSLNIQNFATFTNQQVDFSSGFNTIVGETGSGKSLILDALQMTFGSRADKKLVRLGSDFATIETTFSCSDPKAKDFFNDLGFPFTEDIVIKRVIYASGKSKSFLNYQSCPLSVLSTVTRKYIDLVGQFENQKLLSETYQLKLLDSFGKTEKLFSQYSTSYDGLSKLKSKLIDLNTSKTQYCERKDFLEFQVKELEDLNPSVEDETQLKTEKDRISQLENSKKTLDEVTFLLSESEHSAQGTLEKVEKLLTTSIDNEVLINKLNFITSELTDISYDVSKLNNQESNLEDLDTIVSKLDRYQQLKRKFNTDTEGLSETYDNYCKEISTMKSIDQDIIDTLKSIEDMSTQCHEIAKKLHKKREAAAKTLSKTLTSKVHLLKMVGADIILKINTLEHLTTTGITALSFIAQTNPGEGYHSIKDIASGGELSRILLAVRQALSQVGSISVFLFDEIDTGIGGETALSIGKALQTVSKSSQVIAITHLPQIANQSDLLVLVEKEQVDDRTMSLVKHIKKVEMSPYIHAMQTLN